MGSTSDDTGARTDRREGGGANDLREGSGASGEPEDRGKELQTGSFGDVDLDEDTPGQQGGGKGNARTGSYGDSDR
jgi:hypothetical protein